MEDPEPGAEQLVRLDMKDGTTIDFKRTADGDVLLCQEDSCIRFPKASGQLTVDLIALLESFGKIEEEEPDGEEPAG